MSANFAEMEFVTLAKDGTEGYFPEIRVVKCCQKFVGFFSKKSRNFSDS